MKSIRIVAVAGGELDVLINEEHERQEQERKAMCCW